MFEIRVHKEIGGLITFSVASDRLSGPIFRALVRQSLGDGGLKARTQVRRALREQGGWANASSINQRTRSYMEGDLTFVLEGRGAGQPIVYYKGLRVTGKGIRSGVWNSPRLFQRSFYRGGFRARTTSKRFPVRTLKGPSVGKEIVKDEALATWHRVGPQAVFDVLERKVRRLLP